MKANEIRLAAGVAVLFALLWLCLPGTHLVMDEGYRILQGTSLHRRLAFPVIIEYPGATELGDLAEDVRPMPAHYGTFSSKGLKCFYSPALALVASFFTGKSMLLVPLMSGFLLWLVMWGTLRKMGNSTITTVLIPLLCTPVLFYSLRFWSYPLAILLVYLAVDNAEKGYSWTSYLLVAAAALFRIEFLLACIPVFFRLPGKWYARLLPVLPATAILLAGNWFFSGGNVLGTHIGSSTSELSLYNNAELSFFQQKISAFSIALLTMVPGKTGVAWLLPGLFLWILWVYSLFHSGKTGTVTAAIGLSIALVSCIIWASRGFQFLDGFSMKHPLMVFPILWLFSAATLKRSLPELTMFFVLLLMLLPMHIQGPDWGVRHIFLPVFLMTRNMENSSSCKRQWVVISFGSLVLSASVLFLGINRGRVEQLSRLTGQRAVVTTNWIIPGWFTDNMIGGIPVVYTKTAAALAEALPKLESTEESSGTAIVCLHRDATTTIQILDGLGYNCYVRGEVSFGESLGCLVLIPNKSI